MRKKETIFDYVGQTFKVFGFSILCLNIFSFLFGESAEELSTMFVYGNHGLSLSTMMQFFAIAIIVTLLQALFFTDYLIKKLGMVWRIAAMFISIIAVIAFFIFRYDWFPVNMWEPWVMFFLCFGICGGVSVAVTMIKEKNENEKMQQALARMKKGEKK